MTFGLLAVVVVAGLTGPALAAVPRVRVPAVVGEILAGAVIGRGGLGWVDPSEPTLRFLGEVGLAMLMFVIGTRLPVRDPGLRPQLASMAAATAVTVALAIPAGLLVAWLGASPPAVLVVLVATSSVAVAVPILESGPGGLREPVAAFTAGWITALDVVTVLAVPVVLAGGEVGRALLGAALVTALAVVAWWLGRRFRAARAVVVLRDESVRQGWALDLRLGLAVLFGLAALAVAFGASVLVAGFAAGAVLAALGEPRRLAQQLIGVAEGFLVPLFFVTYGAGLRFAALFSSASALVFGGALVAAAVVVHVLTAIALRRPAASGLVATAALGVPSAVVAVASSRGLFGAEQAAAVTAAALVTVAVAGVGGALLGRRGEVGPAPS
ncbi:cation:proton antiporter domain-containing protein [Actinomycetospora sp. C-140]